MTHYDRLPPQNLDAERSVLGAMILNPDVIPAAAEVLPSEKAFYSEAHSTLYKAILYLHTNDRHPDIVTVMDVLQRWGAIEKVGGPAYIADVSGAAPTSANITHYAEIVRDTYIRREFINALQRQLEVAYAPQESNSFLASSVEELSQIALGMTLSKGSTPKDLKYGYSEWIGKMASMKPGEKPGLGFGIPCLDRILLFGLENDIVFIAGRPSTGKSSLALNLIFNNGKLGVPGILFSLEDNQASIVRRLGHIVCPDEEFMGFVSRGAMKDRFELLRAHQGAVENIPVLIRDDLKHIEDIVFAIRAAIATNPAYMFFIIDYLQIVHTRETKYYKKLDIINQVLSVVGKAKTFLGNRPLIILSQIRRDRDRDPVIGPLLEDLKGSGDIEEHADVVIILHPTPLEEGHDHNIARIRTTVAKARDGPVRHTHLNFAKPKFTFYDPKEGRDIDPKQQELPGEDEVPF